MLKINHNEPINIIGAGLVGTLLAIYLSKRKYKVNIYERRPDPRLITLSPGRSITVTICSRGWKALEQSGLDIGQIKSFTVPLPGRIIHYENGEKSFQPYGPNGEALYAISRNKLNEILLNDLDKRPNIKLFFNKKCIDVKPEDCIVELEDYKSKRNSYIKGRPIIATDGAFSSVRSSILKREKYFAYSHQTSDYAHKELFISPELNKKLSISQDGLHVWPRGKVLILIFPCSDGSSGCSLFLPVEGENSFASLNTEQDLIKFFKGLAPDLLGFFPSLTKQYFSNPISYLYSIKCYPWSYKDNFILLGDAAHAMVPFLGQGMNSGFEDCMVFDQCLDAYGNNWSQVLSNFSALRKPNCDAITDLSLQHFLELAELIKNPSFLTRKKIEEHLFAKYPHLFIPPHYLISFTDLAYTKAKEIQSKQAEIIDKIVSNLKSDSDLEIDRAIDDFVLATNYNQK
jgi:kynurenine 3-monooxygenase